MSRNFKERTQEAGIRIKGALDEIRRYDWHYEREQIKQLPANTKYMLGQATRFVGTKLYPYTPGPVRRLKEPILDGYHFLRSPHNRIQSLSMMEKGLAHIAQDIDKGHYPGIAPIELSAGINGNGNPRILEIVQSITRLRIYRERRSFRVMEGYAYGSTIRLILQPRGKIARIFRLQSPKKIVEYSTSDGGKKLREIQLRWHHWKSRKYANAIEQHVRKIHASKTVQKKWLETSRDLSCTRPQSILAPRIATLPNHFLPGKPRERFLNKVEKIARSATTWKGARRRQSEKDLTPSHPGSNSSGNRTLMAAVRPTRPNIS